MIRNATVPTSPRCQFFLGECGRWLLLSLLLAALFWQLFVYWQWLSLPFPIEYREWAQVDAAARFFSSDSPYSDSKGTGIYLYGFLYPLLGALEGKVAGDVSLVAMRVISLLFTLVAAALSAFIVHNRLPAEESGRLFLPLSAFTLMLYIGWQGVPGLASPAPLGVLLFVLTLMSVERGRTFIAAILTVLAFYVKPYFLAVALPAVLSFWIIHSWRKAWQYIIVWCVLGAVSVWLVRIAFPFYFCYNIVHHLSAASRSIPHLLRQSAWLALLFAPLWLLSFRCKFRQDPFFVATLCMAVVWLWIGQHTGADLTYFLHLVLPPLVVCTLPLAGALPRRWFSTFAVSVLVLPVLAGSLRFFCPLPPTDTQRAVWKALANDVSRLPSSAAVCSPVAAPFAVANGLESLDNGQHQYVSSLYNPAPVISSIFPEQEMLRPRAEGFEPNLFIRLHRHDWPALVIDDRSLLPLDSLRGAGYTPYKTYRLLCGRHIISATLCTTKKR